MLMAWGPYVFEAGAMAFDKLSRQTKARWKIVPTPPGSG